MCLIQVENCRFAIWKNYCVVRISYYFLLPTPTVLTLQSFSVLCVEGN